MACRCRGDDRGAKRRRAGARVDGEVQRLTRLADERSVGGRVQLVGNVRHELVPGLLRSADVVLSTPRRSPARLAPLEAMSCARPVVCSALEGQWALDDGVTGLLIEPGDPGAVRDAVASLLADGDLAGSIGEAGRRAVAPYDWKQVASSVEEAYDSALSPAA